MQRELFEQAKARANVNTANDDEDGFEEDEINNEEHEDDYQFRDEEES